MASQTYGVFLQLFLKAVILPFQSEVDAATNVLQPYLQMNSTKFDPDAIPARRRFLMRRFKLVSNLLRWRKYTGERFGIGQLITKLVDLAMNPVASSGWEVGGEDVMRKVCGCVVVCGIERD